LARLEKQRLKKGRRFRPRRSWFSGKPAPAQSLPTNEHQLALPIPEWYSKDGDG
jgi:hypothetical protein